ncbi:hypothetical protein HGB07_09560 [Candidatus Roizmanbacteria bacterium]|nr:hypothetical protein [Candidatus Roizmanbacteria bacterium]
MVPVLFLCLEAARRMIIELVGLRIIDQRNLEKFDSIVQALKDDCANGNFDMPEVEKDVNSALIDPAQDKAKEEYSKLE